MRDLILSNGESIDVIYEMERQCNDFGPFKETVDEILFRKFRGEDHNLISEELQEQIEYYVNTFDEERQEIMPFNQMCNMISSYLDEYYNTEFELTKDELTQIEKDLNQYLVLDKDFRKLYYSHICSTEYEELIKDLIAEVLASIYGYILPKKYLDISWLRSGRRIIDMDSVYECFKDIVLDNENASCNQIYESPIGKPFEWLNVDAWELISSIADNASYRKLDDWYEVIAGGKIIETLNIPEISIAELHKLYNQQFSVLLGKTLKNIGEALINKDIVIKFTK